MGKHSTEKYYNMIQKLLDGSLKSISRADAVHILNKLEFHPYRDEQHGGDQGRSIYIHSDLPPDMKVTLHAITDDSLLSQDDFRRLCAVVEALINRSPQRLQRLADAIAASQNPIEPDRERPLPAANGHNNGHGNGNGNGHAATITTRRNHAGPAILT